MKKNIIKSIALFLLLIATLASVLVLVTNLPKPTPLTEAEKSAINEDIRRNTKVIEGKDYVHVRYTKWLWESPQENFGIFHSRNRRESWGDYNAESNEIGTGIYFNFTSKESDYSESDHFSWPGEVTPGKEKKHHEEITTTTSIFAPVISEELSSEIKPDSLKWNSWDTMWGSQKSQ